MISNLILFLGVPRVGPQQKYSFPGTKKQSSYLVLRIVLEIVIYMYYYKVC
jgi:hypothetical protein